MIQLLVADDHSIVREGLRRLLHTTDDLRVLAETDNGADVIEAARDPRLNLAIIDLSLPHLAGLDLVRLLRERRPDLRLVIFTMHPEDRLAVHLIRAGASAYVPKHRPLSDLVDAIRVAAAGGCWVSPDLATLLASTPVDDKPHTTLSRREAQVFDLLLQGRSVTEIAQILEINGSTASNHLTRVREKLGVHTTAEVLLYAHRVGLLS
jgi:DNA-binding NarL/FixJ family response regulator